MLYLLLIIHKTLFINQTKALPDYRSIFGILICFKENIYEAKLTNRFVVLCCWRVHMVRSLARHFSYSTQPSTNYAILTAEYQ